MKRKAKRFLSLILCIVLTLTLLPMTAQAAGTVIDLAAIAEGASGTGYAFSGGVLTISGVGPFTITTRGATVTDRRIVVAALAYPNVTLDDVKINVSGSSEACAFDMTGATVSLTLAGTNSLKSGSYKAGLQVPSGATLVIGGTGSLSTAGGIGGAGIGGIDGTAGGIVTAGGGTITISGGTVTAAGGADGAGIGGGHMGSGGTIAITGGTVTANGSGGGAGIGGGYGGSGGTIAIIGGSINSSGFTVTPKNDQGANVYLTTVQLQGVSAVTAVTSLTTTAGYSYGINGMTTDANGTLYLYLPNGTATTGADAGGSTYAGSVTTSANAPDSAGTFMQVGTPPTITTTSPLPGGTVGAAYNQTLTADSATSVTWAVYGGSLPGGLTLTSDGAISGTPAESGTFSFTVQAANSVGSATKALSIGISPAAPARIDLAAIAQGTSGTGYTYSSGVLTISGPGPFTITTNGATVTDRRIVVAAGVSAGITLDGVKIDVSGSSKACALDMTGATVSLTLMGTNSLISGDYKAGLLAPSGATLVIGGTGSLSAAGGIESAGIGGGFQGSGGTITISGGTVTANGNGGIIGGAGIGGGGAGGGGGTITITGGTVMAKGGAGMAGSGGGAGIGGGGAGGSGGTITITGGTVTANGSGDGAGIGGGGRGGTITITGGSINSSGFTVTPKNDRGANVYLTTVQLFGVSAVTAVTSLTTTAGYNYGINGMATDVNGTLYLYLPLATATTGAYAGGSAYAGSVTTWSFNSPGTLSQPGALPIITTISLPDGTAGTAYSQTLTAASTTPVAWTVYSGSLTSGLTLSSDGVISGTPAAGGIFHFTVKASNLAGSNTKILVITINTPGGGSSSGGSSGGGIGTPSNPVTPVTAVVKGTQADNSSVPVTVNSGNARINIGPQQIGNGETTVVTVPSIPGVSSYTLEIPADSLSTPARGGNLTFITDVGGLIVPSSMLTGIGETRENNTGENSAEITISQGDRSDLSDSANAAVGDHPFVELSLTLNGERIEWSNPAAPAVLSIPYDPTASELENPESIGMRYIADNGDTTSIPSSHYDPAAVAVTSTLTHFSYYAVGYNKVSFADVAAGTWYNKAVSFIAAREITAGTGGGDFSHDAKLKRGDFLVMLMKAYDIAPDTSPTDNFSDGGNTYYTGYLSAAKRLRISAGVGNNMYAPGKEITRQEMFTLLYNALKAIGRLPQGNSGKTLSDFTDAGQIEAWAKEAMTLMVKTGTVGGSNGALTPLNTTTRAEMAQVLYNLLGK